MIFAKMATGIPETNRIVLNEFDLRVKYPNSALRANIEIIDRNPLHASTT